MRASFRSFKNLVLRVDHDALAAGEFLEVDAMTAAAEAQLNSIVDKAFPLHALANTHFSKQVNRSLFQHAGANTLFHVLSAAIFNHDRLNALKI